MSPATICRSGWRSVTQAVTSVTPFLSVHSFTLLCSYLHLALVWRFYEPMDTKLKTPTCSRCKIRKIRCDGQSSCHTCSTAGATCEYDDEGIEGRSVLQLRKGAACLACRRKKKKCDGQLPCRTCATGRKKIHCEYPDGLVVTLPLEKSQDGGVKLVDPPMDSVSPDESSIPRHVEPTVPFSDSSDSAGPSGSSDGDASDLSLPPEIGNHPDIFVDLSDIQSPSPFTVPLSQLSPSGTFVTLAELSHARDTFIEDTVKRGLNPDQLMAPDDDMMDTEPPPQADDSPDFPSAHGTAFQVDAPTADSKDEDELSQIRQLFLNHRIQLGLSVTDNVLEALSKGASTKGLPDITLHPVLLHACQLMGYMLARHLQRNTWLCLPGQSEREAEQTRLTLASLQHLGVAACPLAYLQTATLLTLYFFNKGDIVRSRGILAKAGKLLLDHNLDSTLLEPPALGGAQRMSFKPTLTTKTAEAQAVLAQLMYLDLSQTIILKLPRILDPKIHEKFKTLISSPNPHAEINFVRAKAALLLCEAQQLAEEWHQAGLEQATAAAWQARYWELMEALDAHRSFLALTTTRIAFCPELHTLGLSLKVCTVLVLTGLSVLLTPFADAQPELRRKKYAAVGEIISISLTFSEEDCEYLEPILSACWTAVIGTVDYCIAQGPEAVEDSMYDLPAMANAIRQRNKTLQRVVPFAVDV
ncbi:hypothetical protein FB451DRAFT_698654 [Mycena latifolia]|nr:hypothetical protein FB451DRAFT_698654 [Mycena latifolia]